MSGDRTNPQHVIVASTRRAWSADDKSAILAETRAPGATVSKVARRHGLHSSLLFRWRRDALAREREGRAPQQPAFVPLALPAPPAAPVAERPAGTIEVELAGGHRLRAEGRVEASVLRAVIEALAGR